MFNTLRYTWAGASRRTRMIWLLLLPIIPALIYLLVIDIQLQMHFSGARWEIPSRVYARPLELYNSKQIRQADVVSELKAMGYRQVATPQQSGQFSRDGSRIRIYTRAFSFPDGDEPSREVRVYFKGHTVSHVEVLGEQTDSLDILRLEPMFIGAIYPQRQEDRILLKYDQVPPLLIKLLLAVEDRDFFSHLGIKPSAIARALLVNIKAGRAAQGGSTLTQQLVKNFYLSNEKTLWRKIREAFMSLMLEFHYEKKEILEAYLNEVYLGQDGSRAIHGFGMASYFYFSKPLQELQPAELMLLVGLVKGPSAYDPVRFPEAAKKRWQTVYNLSVDQQLLAHSESHSFPSIIRSKQTRNQYPHFIQYVKRQLSRDYAEEDLRRAGLQIFTTLDPQLQQQTEEVTQQQIQQLQTAARPPLQAAMVLTSRHTGEVLAYKGGNKQFDEGFNRAMDARRPVGSLLKPAIYLTALEMPESYHLATPLDDSELTVTLDSGQLWQPQNYDKEFHGEVPLFRALAASHNVAAVRLGMHLGLPKVIDTLERLGITSAIPEYPSVLLGALELSPVEISAMYQTIANAGYYTPIKAIRYVSSADGELLNRYPLNIEPRVDRGANFLLTGLLQQVMWNGTGSYAYRYLDRDIGVAGKTGTTDQLRDSWFAGFSQNYALVSWVGNDDNEPVQLTGASGALKLWAQLISRIERDSLQLDMPENIETGFIDVKANQEGRSAKCSTAVEVPYIKGNAPEGLMHCESLPRRMLNNTRKWLQRWF